jgi:AmpD protein
MTSIDSSLSINDDGWCSSFPRASCPNFDARPADTPISLLVIHNISLPPGEFGGSWIEDLFSNTLDCDAHPYFDQLRGVKVSAHFLVRRDGAVLQFVSVNDRAWHAGVSEFRGLQRCNDFSVGIELEGSDFENFCDVQYQSLAILANALAAKYPITDVVGHQHIAPDRKTDPGPCFDWQRFQREFYKKTLGQFGAAPSQCVLSFPD